MRYLAFTSAGLQKALRYRTSFLVGAATTATTTAIVVFLWRAVYRGAADGALHGYSEPAIITYLLLAQVLTRLHANQVDDEIGTDIMTGAIAVSLVRPVSYPIMRFFLAVPVVAADALLIGVPVIVVFAALFPLQWPTAAGLLYFAVATACSTVLAFAVNLITGMYAVVTTNTWGLAILKASVVGLFSGSLIPVDLLPRPLAVVAAVLPFRSMVDTPVRLFLGRYRDSTEALHILTQQATWTVGLVVLSALLWRALVRRTRVLGG
jgi:ABC-2 type transport system permease protein